MKPQFYVCQTETFILLIIGGRQCYADTISIPLRYYHSDHLGSASWITNKTGTPVQHLQYMPYGEPLVNERTGSYEERFTFTGKERDSETGFSYFGARYYDSDLMTGWLSVDYKADNLVKLVDTDGEKLRYTTGTSLGFKKKFIACVLFGIIYTFFPINVISQNDSIQRIVVKYIEMNDLYPIRIDNAMFEQINPNQFECVLENDYFKLFQNNINNLKQADPEFQKIDIRRKIEITYFSGKIVELYIDFIFYTMELYSYMRENCEI